MIRWNSRKSVRRAPGLLFVASAMAAACSGASGTVAPTGGLSCGPGTEPSHGECLVTQPEADAAAMDSGGSDVGPNDSPSNSDAVGADSETGTGTLDGSPQSADDPCPDSTMPPLWADCSSQCAVQTVQDAAPGVCGNGGGNNLVCATFALDAPGMPEIPIPESDVTIRTPATAVPACETACPPDGGPPTTAAVVLLFDLYHKYGTLTVGAPWHISTPDWGAHPIPDPASCSRSGPHDACAPVGLTTIAIVWTDDPTPAARNIVIRNDTTCP
jgi:hypothetical protein